MLIANAVAHSRADHAHVPIQDQGRYIPIPLPQTASADRIVADVIPRQLSDLFANHVSVQAMKLLEPFLGKWLKVSGQLSDLNKIGTTWHVGAWIREPDGESLQLSLSFENGWGPRLSILSRGANIKVLGQIQEVRQRFVGLTRCELVDL
jgi:hypothetical protein